MHICCVNNRDSQIHLFTYAWHASCSLINIVLTYDIKFTLFMQYALQKYKDLGANTSTQTVVRAPHGT
jgi:hypothetical protein